VTPKTSFAVVLIPHQKLFIEIIRFRFTLTYAQILHENHPNSERKNGRTYMQKHLSYKNKRKRKWKKFTSFLTNSD
jgi:hypothetical protein